MPVTIAPVSRTGVSGTPTAHIVSGIADARFGTAYGDSRSGGNAYGSRACPHGR